MHFIALILLLAVWLGVESIRDVPDSPHVSPTATKGMVIDAGSGGSRLHVYSWKPRLFSTVPPSLSYPEADEAWTERIAPGINSLQNDPMVIGAHLTQLIDFAKRTLIDYRSSYSQFPIYFYATGGMRELAYDDREAIMNTVRDLLRDDNFCPFYFRDDFARIISGEEEAIFSWAATNFLMGTLLPASEGLGIVTEVNHTYGTLDLGGASTQIAFFVPSQDISEGLYKLQIGSQKQWNVYAKSFLTFGVNSARRRHLQQLADDAVRGIEYLTVHDTATDTNTASDSDSSSSSSSSNTKTKKNWRKNTLDEVSSSSSASSASAPPPSPSAHTLNYCFHAGYSEIIQSSVNQLSVEVAGPQLPLPDQLQRCMDSVRPLLEKEANSFCEKAHHGDCSFAGAYQPPLPMAEHGHFIGTSSYEMPWKFLLLPDTAALDFVKKRSDAICQMNFDDVLFYYETNRLIMNTDNLADSIPYFCFLSAYVIVLLKDGYRFQDSQTITVLDEVKGNKVGWPLGAILFEINELPWKLELSSIDTHPWGFMVLAAFIGFFLGAVFAVCMYREVVDANANRNALEQEAYQAMKRIPTLELVRMPTQQSSSSSKNGRSSSTNSGGYSGHSFSGGAVYHRGGSSGNNNGHSNSKSRSESGSSGGGSSSGLSGFNNEVNDGSTAHLLPPPPPPTSSSLASAAATTALGLSGSVAAAAAAAAAASTTPHSNSFRTINLGNNAVINSNNGAILAPGSPSSKKKSSLVQKVSHSQNPPPYTSPYEDPGAAPRTNGSTQNYSSPYISPRTDFYGNSNNSVSSGGSGVYGASGRNNSSSSSDDSGGMDWAGGINVLKNALQHSRNNKYTELPT